MKSTDVRTSVMRKVVRYEKERTHGWLVRFVWVFVGLVGGLGLAIYWVVATLFERQTFVLLALFAEDQEIIADYWQDTVMVFLEELPERPVVLALLLVILLLALWFVTAKRRRRLAKIRSQLETYEKRA